MSACSHPDSPTPTTGAFQSLSPKSSEITIVVRYYCRYVVCISSIDVNYGIRVLAMQETPRSNTIKTRTRRYGPPQPRLIPSNVRRKPAPYIQCYVAAPRPYVPTCQNPQAFRSPRYWNATVSTPELGLRRFRRQGPWHCCLQRPLRCCPHPLRPLQVSLDRRL